MYTKLKLGSFPSDNEESSSGNGTENDSDDDVFLEQMYIFASNST